MVNKGHRLIENEWYTLFESLKCVGPVSRTVLEFQGMCAYFLVFLDPFSIQKGKAIKTEIEPPTAITASTGSQYKSNSFP